MTVVAIIAWAERHIAAMRSVFRLGKDGRDWHRQARRRIAVTGKTAISDEELCKIATEHECFVDAMWHAIAHERTPKEATEELTPERAAEFWDGFSLRLVVPIDRWTGDYYQAQMEHAYEVMRGRESNGESLSYGDPLTPRQAAAIIILFSHWLDHHDIRLDVPLDHDHLGRSDTGDYQWCEECGPIDSDESEHRARTCEKGKACCLREYFQDDEFEDESEEDEQAGEDSEP